MNGRAMKDWEDFASDMKDREYLHLRIKRAMSAIENRRCLEIYYPDLTVTLEIHAVGQDEEGRACVLGYAIANGANPEPNTWKFIELHTAKDVDVCGFFSEAPRPDYIRNDSRFSSIFRQVD